MRASLCLGVVGVLVGGCYAVTTPNGVPCDPLAAECPRGQACIASASGYQCLPEGTPPVVDAALPDSEPAVAPACADDPTLSICLAFDAPQLGTTIANEGTLALAATASGVERAAMPGGGGAALLGATSELAFGPNTEIVGIVAIAATVRLDAALADGTRVGVLDADQASPGLSLFIYAGTTTPHRVRCNIGGTDLYADTAIALGAWTTLACTCEGDTVIVHRDGVPLAQQAGCMAAQGTTTGLQIGQNSRLGDMLPPNEPLIGAIDRVRLWTAVPAAGELSRPRRTP